MINRLTDKVLVGISGGKDSAVLLDLIIKRYKFKVVQPFFLYIIPGLEFQENYLRLIEARYNLKVLRYPSYALSILLHGSTFRDPGERIVPLIKQRAIEEQIRADTGISWIAYGHREGENWRRVIWLRLCKGVELKNRRWYPIAKWGIKQIWGYIKTNKIPTSPEMRFLDHSFGCLKPDVITRIKDRYPADYETIKHYFPYIDALLIRERMKDEKRGD